MSVEKGMSSRFVNIDRTTPMLLPPDLREWVQEDDLALFVVDALSLVDLSAALVNTRGTGSAQYPPAMMLGLLIYCYANGILSSRQIERATYRNVSVRYLAANTHPDHDTIAKFRRENASLLKSVFVQILRLAQQAGLLKLGTIALDGSKIEANAAKRKTLTYAQVQQQLKALDLRIGELLAKAERADQNPAQDEELPAELTDAQTRRARLLEAKKQLEEQAQERHQRNQVERQERPPGDRPPPVSPEPKSMDRVNPTDSESKMTRSARGFIQGYNAQLAVSAQGVGLIVAADVVGDGSDIQQLQPMVKKAIENVGQVPEHVLVDTGYENIRQILAVERSFKTEVLCPPAAIANAGRGKGERRQWNLERMKKRQELKERLKSEAGKRLYELRSQTVEPVFGIIKSVLGLRRFHLRGLEKVRTEWLLMTLAFNFRRLALRWV